MVPHLCVSDLQVEHDRLVVGWSEVERAGKRAAKPVRKAAVETKGHDVAAEMRHLTRTYIGEAGDETGSDCIVVADDRRWLALQRRGDTQELAAIQQLAVREMDVGKGDVAQLDELRPPARQAAGQARGRRSRRARAPRS